MDVIEAIKTRHSYRGEYLPDPVPREDLVTIMEAGLAAPSGCNMQTTSLVAVDDPEMLVKVSEIIGKKVGATAPARGVSLFRTIQRLSKICCLLSLLWDMRAAGWKDMLRIRTVKGVRLRGY